jgi:deoxyribodipyrimidine photo-lyase
VARWVPEVAKLPKKWRHQPWLAPEEVQQTAGLILGTTYPRRITGDAVMQVGLSYKL